MPQIEFTKRLQYSPNDHIDSMKKFDIKDNSKATLKKNKSVTGLPSASVVDNRSTSKNTKSRNSNHVGNIKTSETRVKPKKLSGTITQSATYSPYTGGNKLKEVKFSESPSHNNSVFNHSVRISV